MCRLQHAAIVPTAHLARLFATLFALKQVSAFWLASGALRLKAPLPGTRGLTHDTKARLRGLRRTLQTFGHAGASAHAAGAQEAS